MLGKQAKHNAPPRPMLAVGDRVRVRAGGLQGHRNCLDRANLPNHGHRTHRHDTALHSEGLGRRQAAQGRGGGRWTAERPGTHEQPGKCAWLPDLWLHLKAAKTHHD